MIVELKTLEEPWTPYTYNSHKFHTIVLCTKLVVFADLFVFSYNGTQYMLQGQDTDFLEAEDQFHLYNILLESSP